MPELNFKGKEFVYNHHLTVPFRPLDPHADKSILGEDGQPSLDGNLIIHGDNLHALKALLPMYAGKVDCIFIDPPYNTGQEGWCYNDNVNSPMIREWFDSNPIGLEDGLRHDKWACMMWPRLRLLHDLLADQGSLWITLDDNEAHRCKLMLDEIFGAEGFVANIIWEHSAQGKGYSSTFSVHHNHLLVYGKPDFSFDGLERTEKDNINYSNPDGDPRGPWRSGDVRNSLYRPNLKYDLKTPSGKSIPPPENGWRWQPSTMQSKIESGEVMFVDDETKIIRKIYLEDQDKRAPETIWFADDVGSTRDATGRLKEIFGGESPFPTPKPVELLARILQLVGDKSALVLDSFAGSGTTADAVLSANSKDHGNRRFILVEGEEYAEEITAERVRRVINGYAFKGTQREELLREPITFTKLKNANTLLEKVQQIEMLDGPKFDRIKPTVKDGVLIVTGELDCEETAPGLGGSFTFCTLGDPIDMDGLLTGADLPPLDQLAALLYHTATAQAFVPGQLVHAPDIGAHVYRLGAANGRHLWLFYKPDLDWLKSADAALTLSNARAIAATEEEGVHLVFASAKFVSRDLLAAQRIPVEYAPLPYALYRVETA